jgi:hypothetical protein
MSNYDISKIFDFNLIPPKTVEEIQVLEERDNSIVYGFFLIFFVVLVYSILSLFQTLLVDVRVSNAEKSLASRIVLENGFSETKAEFGQLFLKSKALSDTLKKNIAIVNYIDAASDLSEIIPQSYISSYNWSQEKNEFVVTINVGDFSDAVTLLEKSSESSKIEGLKIKKIDIDPLSYDVRVYVAFKLKDNVI